ncbi:MAG: transposon-transfer assisting family protein [Oscillospiraceae bacterium]
MKVLSAEEVNFIAIYCGISKNDTLEKIFEAMPLITDLDMKNIAEHCIEIISELSDEEFLAYQFSDLLQ